MPQAAHMPAEPSSASNDVGDDADRLLALGDGLLSGRTRSDLHEAARRRREAQLNVVVLGAFKRGKSTLVNSLLDRAVLPTGVLPLTSVVTEVAHGRPERLNVEYETGALEDRPLDELVEFVTQERNPDNRLLVRAARVMLDHPLLSDGLRLIDTPGVASIHAHNTDSAHATFGRVDAALCVLSVDQPLAQAELELIGRVSGQASRTILVVNKVDLVEPQEHMAALAFVAGGLRAAGLTVADADVIGVSARDGSGVDDVRTALSLLRGDTRDELVGRSLRRAARAAASELERVAATERAALELPLAELDTRAARLRGRMLALSEARADADDLLRRRTGQAVEQHVDEPLLSYARAHRHELDAALDEEVARVGVAKPRALSRALDAWIDERVRLEMATLVPAVSNTLSQELDNLNARHAEIIRRLLRELEGAAADLFDTPLASTPPSLRIRDASRFSFKLRDPEHAIDVLAAGARTAAPGALGRRLVVRAARERLHAMVDRHAGRLRSDLSDRATAATTAYARDLAQLLDETAAAVESAVARARAQRMRGGAQTEQRRQELGEIAADAAAIRERLDGGAPA